MLCTQPGFWMQFLGCWSCPRYHQQPVMPWPPCSTPSPPQLRGDGGETLFLLSRKALVRAGHSQEMLLSHQAAPAPKQPRQQRCSERGCRFSPPQHPTPISSKTELKPARSSRFTTSLPPSPLPCPAPAPSTRLLDG